MKNANELKAINNINRERRLQQSKEKAIAFVDARTEEAAKEAENYDSTSYEFYLDRRDYSATTEDLICSLFEEQGYTIKYTNNFASDARIRIYW